MQVIIDTETDALRGYKKLWLIVCREVDTGLVHTFRRPDLNPFPFLEFSQRVTQWIGHNLISFDWLVLQAFGLTMHMQEEQCLDTLILSRLLKFNQEGGHSLENWGLILNSPKGQFSDFSSLTEEMITYCTQDTLVTLKIYLELKRYVGTPEFSLAIPMEHKLQFICNSLHKNGFPLKLKEAQELLTVITKLRDSLTLRMQEDFPPRPQGIREVTPKVTAKGILSSVPFGFLKRDTPGVPLDLTPYAEGSPFSLIEYIPFNPASSRQAVRILNEAKWRPFNRTTAHNEFVRLPKKDRDPVKAKYFQEYGWKVDEDNLSSLPADAPQGARLLVRWRMITKRLQTLVEWLEAYNTGTTKVHGSFNGIGTWTHRMAHNSPNMGNPPSVNPRIANEEIKAEAAGFGKQMRQLWTVSDQGNQLVGVDADAIQLRVLAHLINSEKLITSIVTGSKEEGTDPHTLNWKALGKVCKGREVAKTFIYAVLLGAQDGKVADIFGCSIADAKEARGRFLKLWPEFQEFVETQVPRDAKRGYFEGLDGRLVVAVGETFEDKKRTMLSGYLQNGEACVMKHACTQWHRELDYCKDRWWFRNFVHDEWQTEVQGNEDFVNHVASTQMKSIKDVGLLFNLRLPLLGTKKIGKTWMETH